MFSEDNLSNRLLLLFRPTQMNEYTPGASQEEIDRIRNDPEYRKNLKIALDVIYAQNPNPKTYRDNRRAVQDMITDKVWYLLATDDHPKMISIAQKYDVKVKTLYRFSENLKENPDWVPTYGNAEQQAVLTEKQKDEIKETLMDLYHAGVQISENLVRIVILSYYAKIPEEERNNSRVPFNCSRKYITRLMLGVDFSHRRAHPKRRPDTDPVDIDQWRAELRTAIQKSQEDHILNADETFWRCADQGLYTWAPKGAESIQLVSPNNDKAGFTALATIRYDGSTLPLILIAKGKTQQCERSHFGFFNPLRNSSPDKRVKHYTTHSNSGWVDNDVWDEYLAFIRSQIPYKPGTAETDQVNKILLLCDSFGAHHTDRAKQKAQELNIDIILIPPGATDECQPLDCRIFGIIKALGRKELNRRLAANIKTSIDEGSHNFEIPVVTKADAAQILIRIWENLSKNQVRAGWIAGLVG